MPFDDDAADDVTDYGPPPHPDDRLWRHPSELVTPQASVPRVAPHRWPWGLVAGAGTVGVMLVGIGAFVVGLRDRVVAQRESATVAINPVGDAVQTFGPPGGPGGPGVGDRTGEVTSSLIDIDGIGTGSGIVVSGDGVVITSAEVVGDRSQVKVRFDDGSRTLANTLGADPRTGVAVLDLANRDLDSARLVAPNPTTLGKTVVLVGRDGEGNLLKTTGSLEAAKRPSASYGEARSDMLAVVPADQDLAADLQGAAVVDANGSVLGVVTGAEDDVLYVVPIDVARDTARNLLTVGVATSGS